MDLCEIGPAMGEFDYIIAHGVYSWVPDGVRDRLLAVCRERLTPQGVACISYNALPGRHVRMMLREMMQYHTRDCAEPGERVERARELSGWWERRAWVRCAWQPMIDEGDRAPMLTGNAGWFFHDDLAAINDSSMSATSSHARRNTRCNTWAMPRRTSCSMLKTRSPGWATM